MLHPRSTRTISWACTIQAQPAKAINLIVILYWHMRFHREHQASSFPYWITLFKAAVQLRLPCCLETQVPQLDSPSTTAVCILFPRETILIQTFCSNPHPAFASLSQKFFHLTFTITVFASRSLANSIIKAREGKKEKPGCFSTHCIFTWCNQKHQSPTSCISHTCKPPQVDVVYVN